MRRCSAKQVAWALPFSRHLLWEAAVFNQLCGTMSLPLQCDFKAICFFGYSLHSTKHWPWWLDWKRCCCGDSVSTNSACLLICCSTSPMLRIFLGIFSHCRLLVKFWLPVRFMGTCSVLWHARLYLQDIISLRVALAGPFFYFASGSFSLWQTPVRLLFDDGWVKDECPLQKWPVIECLKIFISQRWIENALRVPRR